MKDEDYMRRMAQPSTSESTRCACNTQDQHSFVSSDPFLRLDHRCKRAGTCADLSYGSHFHHVITTVHTMQYIHAPRSSQFRSRLQVRLAAWQVADEWAASQASRVREQVLNWTNEFQYLPQSPSMYYFRIEQTNSSAYMTLYRCINFEFSHSRFKIPESGHRCIKIKFPLSNSHMGLSP